MDNIKCIIHRYDNGNIRTKFYCIEDSRWLHNPNGPALVNYFKDGSINAERYFINNELHNANGPAWIIYNQYGIKEKHYWFNGVHLPISSNEELERYIKLNNIS